MAVSRAIRAAIVAAVIASAAIGGGCSRCGRQGSDTADGTAQSAGSAPAEDPADILSHPVPFDAQSMAECAALAMADRTLTTAEVARIIVTTEAAVNHLGMTLEELQRNDDAADTYNVLAELDADEWPRHIATAIAGLDRQPLDAPERERLENMKAAMERNDIVRADLVSSLKR